MSESAIVMWESGSRRPRIRTAARYGALLRELADADVIAVLALALRVARLVVRALARAHDRRVADRCWREARP